MSIKLQWSGFLKRQRTNFIGGEIRHIEDTEGTFKGPLKDIVIHDDKVVITTEWTAHLPTNGKGVPRRGARWTRVVRTNAKTFTYKFGTETSPLLSAPQAIGKGLFFFSSSFSKVFLLPKGCGKLDPQEVGGL